MCGYYFDLKEVFLEQAGIKPAATTDDVFGRSGDSQDFFHTNDGNNSDEGNMSDSSFVNEKDGSDNNDDNTPKTASKHTKKKSTRIDSAKKQREVFITACINLIQNQ